MNEVTHDIKNGQKLGQNATSFSYGGSTAKPPRPNGQIKRFAEPHIEHKKNKGKLYYYYRRGTDRKIYLGTADDILKAVQSTKCKQNRNK